jgi:hypothetical protein
VVATGALFEVAGAGAACSAEPESSSLVFVDVLAAKGAELALVAAVVLGRLIAMAAAPRAPAAPAPRVIADTQASPLLRATWRAEAEWGELLTVLQSGIGGRGLLRCSWSMRPRSITGLCSDWVLPLNSL